MGNDSAQRPRNLGVIVGKFKIDDNNLAKVQLDSVVGEGKITIFDESGRNGSITTTTDSQGHFILGFMWDPIDIAKAVNTNLRARVSVSGVKTSDTYTSYTILKNRDIPLCVCSKAGGNTFSPLEGYVGRWAGMSLKIYGILIGAPLGAPFSKILNKIWNMPVISTVSKVSPEMYCMFGLVEE